jgi:hypothetical protein
LHGVTYQSTSIATSTAQNDGGVFDLNFRDERYLPFEGAGAISKWSLSLPKEIRQFDYNTISDVVVHVSYTALYGGDDFKGDVEANMISLLKGVVTCDHIPLTRLFSLKYEFPDAFHQLLANPDEPQLTDIAIGKEHFPYFMSSFDLTASSVTIFVRSKEGKQPDLSDLTFNETGVTFDEKENDLQESKESISITDKLPATWTITSGNGTSGGGLKREDIADILLAVQYKAADN